MMGRLGWGSPRVQWGVVWSFGASPVRGGDESGGGNKRKSIWTWRKKRGSCGIREFVAMKDVGAVGGARTSVLPGSLGHVSPETERSLGSDWS